MLDKQGADPKAAKRPPLLGFKVHLRDVDIEPGRCEIYSFEGGYAGLSFVEDGVANFCFLVKANSAKKFGGKGDLIAEGAVKKNKRAAVTLKNAQPVYDWLAVAVDRWDTKKTIPSRRVYREDLAGKWDCLGAKLCAQMHPLNSYSDPMQRFPIFVPSSHSSFSSQNQPMRGN